MTDLGTDRRAEPLLVVAGGAPRNNNFNLIRMLAATGVLISHAFPLSLGPTGAEPLHIAFNGANLGRLCVFVFFAISGFFITQSFSRRASLSAFVQARVLRIFPALAVVLLASVLVAGLFLTTAPAPVFWDAAPDYFFNNLVHPGRDGDLPGVFETNPYPKAINGSLWTLLFEVACYAGVIVLGLSGLLSRRAAFAPVVGVSVLAYGFGEIRPLPYSIDMLMYVGLPFLVGMVFFVWRDRIPRSIPVAGGLVVTAALLRVFFLPAFEGALVVALAYCVFLAGFWPNAWLQAYNRLGDYSYGMYIYAFPVQQLVTSLSPAPSPLQNIAFALPVTLGCAVLSWHLIEAPALSLRHPARTRSAPRMADRR